MGTKGDKLSNKVALSAQLLVDKLAGIDGIKSKKMFGGYGIFCNDQMFGIVDPSGKIFFKADDTTKGKFEDIGSLKHSRMPYYSIPDNVLSNFELLLEWAESSISITK